MPLKRGVLISASTLSSRPDKGRAPLPSLTLSSARQGKRTRATRLASLPACSVNSPQSLEKEVFVGGRLLLKGGRSCLSYDLASALGIPSHKPGGLCPCGWLVGLPSYAYLGNPIQFALHFSAPNKSPHFTAVCSLDFHARNTGP